MLQTGQIPKQKIDELCRKYRVKELDLVGDDFRRDFGNGEDADLLVDYLPEAKTTISDFLDLEEELQRLIGMDIVLISKRGLKEHFRVPIQKGTQILYAS